MAITDFSEASTHAICFAASLFNNSSLSISMLHTYEDPTDKDGLLISINDILGKDSLSGLEQQSHLIRGLLPERSYSITTHSAGGKFGKIIPAVIKATSPDLIVTGSIKDKNPKNPFLKIPTLYLGQTTYPVLTIPETAVIKSVHNILILSFYKASATRQVEKQFEQIVNHDHTAFHSIYIGNDTTKPDGLEKLQRYLQQKPVDMLVVLPAPGDSIENSLKAMQIHDLNQKFTTLLGY